MRALLLALQLATAPEAGAPAPRAEPAVWARVERAVRGFQRAWREAWQETQGDREMLVRDDARDADIRSLALHCHWSSTPWRIQDHVITGTRRAHATCPIWAPERQAVADERRGIDGGLRSELRPQIRTRRGALRALLDSAARAAPGDVRLTRLRVRFALDDGDAAGARAVVEACAARPDQCALLRAFLVYREGDAAAADSAFLAAARALPEEERCAWRDVRALLEPELRREYERMSCSARAELEERLWWLADPLFLEPGNERRAEHFARRVLVTLFDMLDQDERQHWLPAKGGEAVAESLVRYGWPTRMDWGGRFADDAHGQWLTSHGAQPAPPYLVREYTQGRLHPVPSAAALRAPLEATRDDWRLNAPADDEDWWPREHYARDRSAITELPAGQTVLLRRRDAARLVWAGDLDAGDLARPAGDSVRFTLFESRSPSELARVAAFDARVGAPLRVDAPLRAGATLVGIELPGDTARPAARTRFGASVPEPLSALAGGRAQSDPLLYNPPATAGSALDANGAVRRMFGTTTLAVRRLGVYWEVYGFAPTDTVEIELRVTREDRPGFLRRLAGALRLAGEVQGEIGVRTRDVPGSGAAVHRVEGDVRVQMRSVVLDLSRLPRGRYRLSVATSRPGGPAVTSARALVLR